MVNFEKMMSNMKDIINFADLVRSYGITSCVLDRCKEYSLEKKQTIQLAICVGKECCEDGINYLARAEKIELFDSIKNIVILCNDSQDFINLLIGNNLVIKYLTRFISVFYEDLNEILNNTDFSHYDLLLKNVRGKLYCDCCGEEIVGSNGMMLWVARKYDDRIEICDVKYGHYGMCNYKVESDMDHLGDYVMTSGLDRQLYDASGLEKFIDYVSYKDISKNAVNGLSKIYGESILNILQNI